MNEFALARVSRGKTAFDPLTHQRVMLNGIANQANPLFDKGIIALGLLETTEGLFGRLELPVVVTQNEPARLYLFDKLSLSNTSLPNTIALGSTKQLVRDAARNESAGVVGLTTNTTAHVFAAVKPNGGNFGDANSGIALALRGFIQREEDGSQKTFRTFVLVDAPTGQNVQNPRAVQLDRRSPEVRITNDAANIENVVDMHFDKSLNRLFIALQVTADNGVNDGARALVVGRLGRNNQLLLSPIAPDAAFQAGNQNIIGVRGVNQRVSLHKVRTMFTSTALHYVIVVGGNGVPDATRRTVFALPLVNGLGSADGTLANKDANPQDRFMDSAPNRIQARELRQAAIIPAHMVLADEGPAQIGGGVLNAGNIVDIIIRGDTVFALIGEPQDPNKSGIYFSQALFESNGKIKGWTQWQRAVGTIDQIFGTALDANNGSFMLMSGDDADQVTVVKRTVWADGNQDGLQPLKQILSSEFDKNQGGIQGMFHFTPNTPALNNISLSVATGLAKVAIVQTGVFDDVIVPLLGDDFDNIEQFENGTITQDINDTTIVIVSGGVLDEIGPIVAAEVARNGIMGNNGWLFVGGINGLAVLSQADGTGWANGQLQDGIEGLVDGMSFKKIGDYTLVKKLIHDGDFLYVLTDTKLDRINLTQGNVGLEDIRVVTLAATNDGFFSISNSGGFIDCVISGSFGLLATTGGLFRVGNGKRVSTATNEADVNWTSVIIPEGIKVPIQLIVVSPTGRHQDVAQGIGGNIYVLSAHVGVDQARLHRFAVQGIIGVNPIQADTIQLFNDLFIQNIKSFFLGFGTFIQQFVTDGAVYFTTESKEADRMLKVQSIPSTLMPRTGVPGIGNKASQVPILLGSGTQITTLARNVGSGSWILGGDFGLRVHE